MASAIESRRAGVHLGCPFSFAIAAWYEGGKLCGAGARCRSIDGRGSPKQTDFTRPKGFRRNATSANLSPIISIYLSNAIRPFLSSLSLIKTVRDGKQVQNPYTNKPHLQTMDLLSTIRKTGSRGGVNFSWDEVANSSRRENYLGHSLKAPVGRWQKGKDLNWYAKADSSAANADETEEEREARERKEELRRIKEAEEDAIARALGLPVKQRDTTGANAVEVANKRQIGPAAAAPEPAELHRDTAAGEEGGRRGREKSRRHREGDRRDRDRHHRRNSRSRSRGRDRDYDAATRRRHRSRSRDRGHRERRPRVTERDSRDDRDPKRQKRERSRSRSRDRGGQRHREERHRRRSRSASRDRRHAERERGPRR